MTSNVIPSAGAVGWAATVTNAISDPQTNGFRLTLTTLTPVTTSDVSGATTIYLTPYTGNRISLYDGSNWQVLASAEVSLALGTLTSGTNYDVFAYDNGGTLAIDTLVAWTNNTTRATALVRQDGVWVKSGATTRRYVGTIRMTSTTQTEDSKAKRFVWNASNRVPRVSRTKDTTTSWTRTTTGYQAANSGDADWKVELVRGLDEEPVSAVMSVLAQCDASAVMQSAIGLDSTSSVAADSNMDQINQNTLAPHHATYVGLPGLGYHYLQGLDINTANAGTATYYSNGVNGGLHVLMLA